MQGMKVALLVCLAAWGAWSSSGEHFAWLVQPTEQKEVIAACLILEAGGEGVDGMQAVMNVIQNRAGGNPLGYYTQVIARKQFSCMNSLTVSKRPMTELLAKAKDHKRWQEALRIVDAAAVGVLPDLTGGATHYYATSLKKAPSWATQMQPTLKLKNHYFLRSAIPVVAMVK